MTATVARYVRWRDPKCPSVWMRQRLVEWLRVHGLNPRDIAVGGICVIGQEVHATTYVRVDGRIQIDFASGRPVTRPVVVPLRYLPAMGRRRSEVGIDVAPLVFVSLGSVEL